jgi:outer membrane protein
MKNVNLVLNVLLTMAVVVLFALYFKDKKSGNNEVPSAAIAAANTNLRIAFFNSDTLMSQYEYFKVERTKLEEETKKAEQELVAKQKAFEKEATDFQQRAQFLTITDKEAKQEKLYMQQQQLAQLEQQLTNRLTQQESAVNKEIFYTIETFLKEYAKKNGFTYVLSYARGGGIWYAESKLDITADMLKILNEQYANKKTE